MHTIFYDAPARNWNEALPLGNGRMGAMVFGGTRVERIALNEDSLWYGGFRDRVNPDAREALPRIRQLLREDRIREATTLAEEALSGVPDGERHYEPLCDLILQQLDENPAGLHGFRSLQGKDLSTYDSPSSLYHRELDLESGIVRVAYQTKDGIFARECFLSYPHGVMALRHTGLPCRVLLRRSAYLNTIRSADDRTLLISGTTGDGGVSYVAGVRALGEGARTVGSVLRCPAQCDLLLAAATSFSAPADASPDALEAAVLQTLQQAERLGYDALRNAHISDFRGLMHACTLQLDEHPALSALPMDQRLKRYAEGNEDTGLEALYFTYGRYLLSACSRPGGLPANLQGVWNESFLPPWDSKYTININTEMNYWPAESLNLSRCALPLFDHLHRMLPRGRAVARDMYGLPGWVAHHNTDIWGDCAPQDTYPPATYWPMGAAWLTLHIAEHVRFTRDLAFLRRELPLMEEAATFLLSLAEEDEDGIRISPSTSPENTYITPCGTSGSLTDRAAMDQQILWELLTALEEMDELLGKDAAPWTAFKQKLHPVQIRNGRIQEWLRDCEEAFPGHRHLSHLFALYPGHGITASDPEAFQAARATLEHRLAHGGGHTGWSRAWIICLYARLLDGTEAARHLRLLLEQSTLPNLFDNHPPFQIDGNFGAIAGISEMLVQSHEGVVRILPARPPHWTHGEIRGIRIRGACTLDLRWVENEWSAEVFPDADGTLRLSDGRSFPLQAFHPISIHSLKPCQHTEVTV